MYVLGLHMFRAVMKRQTAGMNKIKVTALNS